MKKARIIIGSIFAAIAIAVSVGVCVEWYSHGCDYISLLLAIIFYCSSIFGIWYTIDSTIKEENQ